MSVENTLKNMTTSSGLLADRTVYFGDVYTKKLNGVPLSTLKSEGNDQISPFSYSEISSVANKMKVADVTLNKRAHDYDFYTENKDVEKNGLPGSSTNPVFKNSAIGSKAGGIFGNEISVISSNTDACSTITPMSVESNIIFTDDLRARAVDYSTDSPKTKKIRLNSDMEVAPDQIIEFSDNNAYSITSIKKGHIITSQIGEEEIPLKIAAKGIEVEGDIEMGGTNKIITSQLQADDVGTLAIKADKIHFAANEITFDPDSTEITTGNFPQVIANLSDYESTQKATVYIYSDPTHKDNTENAIFTGSWKLQMFYNVIVCKVKFSKLTDETRYREKMGGKQCKDLYLQFPTDYYAHFCDFFGKEDEDNYVTDTEIIYEKDGECTTRSKVSVYFNAKYNNFLKLQYNSLDGSITKWPESFINHSSMKLGHISFTVAVSTTRLKRQYQSSTPSTFMKKPDFYETITPRKKIMMPRLSTSNIYNDNAQQCIAISEDLISNYELQAAVTATKIHKLAFFEVRFSFIDKYSSKPVPFNDAIKVMKDYKNNPTKFLITFIPNAEVKRFALSDETNTNHTIRHPICGVKFIYNPKAELGLTKAILDFSTAKTVPSEDDVTMCLQFYHITMN